MKTLETTIPAQIKRDATYLGLRASGWYLNAVALDYVSTFLLASHCETPNFEAINAARTAFSLIHDAYVDCLEQFNDAHSTNYKPHSFDDMMTLTVKKLKNRTYLSEKPWIPSVFKDRI